MSETRISFTNTHSHLNRHTGGNSRMLQHADLRNCFLLVDEPHCVLSGDAELDKQKMDEWMDGWTQNISPIL